MDMPKFLSKQEVIDILESLPDLPIVIERDCDSLRSTGIQQIEVRKSCKSKRDFDIYHEYMDTHADLTEDVIWIS